MCIRDRHLTPHGRHQIKPGSPHLPATASCASRVPLELVGREQSAIRQASTAVFDMDEAADFWFKGFTNFVKKIGRRTVAGSLFDGRARRTHGAQFFEMGFQWVHVVDTVSVRWKICCVNFLNRRTSPTLHHAILNFGHCFKNFFGFWKITRSIAAAR